MTDSVNHPTHYNSHPSGVECITVTEHMNFNIGNAVKYLWRVGLKSEDPIVDLKKALWYVQREIDRLTPKPKLILTSEPINETEAQALKAQWQRGYTGPL